MKVENYYKAHKKTRDAPTGTLNHRKRSHYKRPIDRAINEPDHVLIRKGLLVVLHNWSSLCNIKLFFNEKRSFQEKMERNRIH